MVLPAVLLVLVAGLGVAQAGMVRVRLADSAADAARLLGRGETLDRATARVAEVHPGASLSVARADGVVCVTAVAALGLGGLDAMVDVRARGCAVDDTTVPVPSSSGVVGVARRAQEGE